MKFQDELREYLISQGACDVGFFCDDSADFGDCRYGVSVVVRLSDAIVDEIGVEPTHTYFNHYRSVNAFIDSLLLKTGLFLQQRGYRYITVAASQSINKDGWNYRGRYSHKKGATLSGLGTIGKSSMFLHRDYGSRVRLGTVFTDCAFDLTEVKSLDLCSGCDLCVKACPSGAITGNSWYEGCDREYMFRPEKCSEYMKQHFKDIGRGAVCGICMKVCPYASESDEKSIRDGEK